ncbi:MAG: glycosyltransferase [Steroidobacter sp.]
MSLNEGGTLSILLDLATHLQAVFDTRHVVYLINDRVASHFDGRRYECYSWPKASWANRLYFEKVFVKRIEQRLKPRLWLSLHDITASLRQTPQLLYCHNPSPFLDRTVRLPVLDVKFALFVRFYEYLYRWGINRNKHVIVQQDWLRTEFLRRFHLDSSQVMVARPVSRCISRTQPVIVGAFRKATAAAPLRLLYPALPRVFKNIEYLGELAKLLADEPIEFSITISGDENPYARFLWKNYAALGRIRFIGRQSRAALFDLYRHSDALIFPSHLETWGLPLSEFMQTGKPILAADLPYAREVLSDYSAADLFSLDNVGACAQKIRKLAAGEFSPVDLRVDVAEPFCPDWNAFVQFIERLAP